MALPNQCMRVLGALGFLGASSLALVACETQVIKVSDVSKASILASENGNKSHMPATDIVTVGRENGAKGQAIFSSDHVEYMLTIMAPDSCHVAEPMSQVKVGPGSNVHVGRVLNRNPGLCAQVMTPVEFFGQVSDLPEEPELLVLTIKNDQGRILDTFEFQRNKAR
ncbi:hypothetical protein GFB49_07630 [Epibacterium sp. SM1979]|uniref:Uncharacterized protein n=1 Tax=Tritonibacter litoralis TaxID=2662264 RepID=A0A843YBF1_9RHOB|nr:hypothetical protein [Tritonibacter litoralis]MQQ08316.1 hypothetical protein [Tritonibacter litoralis]